MRTSSSEIVLKKLTQVVGSAYVRTDIETLSRYHQSTGEYDRTILGVVQPASTAEIVKIVQLASKYSLALYPISTGKNWGYGTAKPVVDDCFILDLSRMQRTVTFDAELGIITLEPGVTQQQLYEYLERNKLPYVAPTTGAGPNTSILGNILERGYGLAPYSDHFSAVTSIEAILADGSIYKPALAALGAYETERAFKYGLGAYLDGIFTQSNFGIVTEITIILKQKVQRTDLFVFWVGTKEKLKNAVSATHTIMSSYKSIVPTIKLVSQLRSFAITNQFPKNLVSTSGALDAEGVAKLSKKALLTPWVGIGIIAGEKEVVRAARRGIRRVLKAQRLRYAFFSHRLMKFILYFTQRKPCSLFSFAASFNRLAGVMDMFQGKPDFTEHHIDYWKDGKPFPDNQDPDPARDGTGLFWYAPLVPMKPTLLNTCVSYIERICREHGIEPLITASALSSTCFDVTTYLLFDPGNQTEVEKAHACYQALFIEGQTHGLLPYRLNIDFMELPEKLSPDVWRVVDRIKKTLDPKDCIAPGRYATTKRTGIHQSKRSGETGEESTNHP